MIFTITISMELQFIYFCSRMILQFYSRRQKSIYMQSFTNKLFGYSNPANFFIHFKRTIFWLFILCDFSYSKEYHLLKSRIYKL